jgi:hypothetical protein
MITSEQSEQDIPAELSLLLKGRVYLKNRLLLKEEFFNER